MNERIQELLEQTGWGKGNSYDDCLQCSPFDPDKFAELIVLECVQLLDTTHLTGTAHYVTKEVLTAAQGIIKKHF